MDTGSQSRDWLSTIVFTDIVGYSERSLDQQISIKEHFNKLITDSIKTLNESERVIIDTGDGVALCFLGDPEQAIVVSMDLRLRVIEQSQQAPEPYQVRTGINLGPVRLVTDINGQFNVLGDGINVAQRIMDFASPSQVLVSRSFYDVAWCISDEYSGMFSYYGIRKDKHAREHALYEVALLSEDEAYIDLEEKNAEPEVDEFTRIVRSRLASDTAPITETVWDPDVLRRIENSLMEYIGPVAKVLVHKEAIKTLSMEDLYVRLVRAIPAGPARSAFMEKTAEYETTSVKTQNITERVDALGETGTEQTVTTAILTMEWSEEVLEAAKQALVPFVGPLASMLVRKASRRASSLVDLYNLLAREIADPKECEQFLSHMPENK
ncbi:MAG: adenylate/guanylate cyclase domain-containing protein [Acidiferrobacterales bacterium]